MKERGARPARVADMSVEMKVAASETKMVSVMIETTTPSWCLPGTFEMTGRPERGANDATPAIEQEKRHGTLGTTVKTGT